MGRYMGVFDKKTHIQRTWYAFFPVGIIRPTHLPNSLWPVAPDISTNPHIMEIESMIQGDFFWDGNYALLFVDQADRDLVKLIYG